MYVCMCVIIHIFALAEIYTCIEICIFMLVKENLDQCRNVQCDIKCNFSVIGQTVTTLLLQEACNSGCHRYPDCLNPGSRASLDIEVAVMPCSHISCSIRF